MFCHQKARYFLVQDFIYHKAMNKNILLSASFNKVGDGSALLFCGTHSSPNFSHIPQKIFHQAVPCAKIPWLAGYPMMLMSALKSSDWMQPLTPHTSESIDIIWKEAGKYMRGLNQTIIRGLNGGRGLKLKSKC